MRHILQAGRCRLQGVKFALREGGEIRVSAYVCVGVIKYDFQFIISFNALSARQLFR